MEKPEFAMTVEASPDCRVMSLWGPFTMYSVFEFQRVVREDNAALTVVDMGAVPFIDSAALGSLIGAVISAQKAGTQLVLASVTERVRSTLQMTQVDRLFEIAATVDEARSKRR